MLVVVVVDVDVEVCVDVVAIVDGPALEESVCPRLSHKVSAMS